MIFISYTSLVASAANSEVDIGFCWTLYSWYRPLLPFTICLIGAGIVDAILPYPDLRGTHSFGGITYTTIREVRHAYTLYQSLGNIYLVYTKQTVLDLTQRQMTIPQAKPFGIIIITCTKHTTWLLITQTTTFAKPARWAPRLSIYSMYLVKSLNSSIVGRNTMIRGMADLLADVCWTFSIINLQSTIISLQ